MKKINVLFALFTSIFMCSCSVKTYMEYSNYSSYHPIEKDEEFSDIKAIDITWLDGNVNFIVNEQATKIILNEEISDKNVEKKYYAQIYKNDTALSIQYFSTGATYVGNLKKTLNIIVPINYELEKITINNILGDTRIKGANAQSIQVSSTSGSISVEENHAKNIQVNSTKGSTYVKANKDNENIKIYKTSGTVVIDMIEDIQGFVINYDNFTGKLNTDYELTKNEDADSYGTNFDVSLYLTLVSSNVTIN